MEDVLKVMALVAIAAVLNFVGAFVLMATHDGKFLDVTFEVASAFGNVGLTRNYTPGAWAAGQDRDHGDDVSGPDRAADAGLLSGHAVKAAGALSRRSAVPWLIPTRPL